MPPCSAWLGPPLRPPSGWPPLGSCRFPARPRVTQTRPPPNRAPPHRGAAVLSRPLIGTYPDLSPAFRPQ
eukprot:12433165-Alexandrium_andersonii.AAC.1